MRIAKISDAQIRKTLTHVCDDLDAMKEAGYVRRNALNKFPTEYCSVHRAKTIHYNGKCLKCLYGER